MHRRWYRTLVTRRILIFLILLLQIAVLLYFLITGSRSSQIITVALEVLSLISTLVIITRRDKGAYKLTWVYIILLFPVFGGLLYLIVSFQSSTRSYRRPLSEAARVTRPLFPLRSGAFDDAAAKYPQYITQLRYLEKFAGFPVYSHTGTEYFPLGEDFFAALLTVLERAEKYIFLEYFIVQEGKMWNTILEILKRKAAAGVTVRLIYDDIGCFLLLPKDYPATLAKSGIECRVMNPFRPFLTVMQNNRDHRKICSVDGKVAFTGGINLADEYINERERFGHWKDAAVMLRGEAAWSMTLMFLQMWNITKPFLRSAMTAGDYMAFCPWRDTPCELPSDGFVQPYADSPMDHENVGEHVYMHLITGARKYLYINTPYLIIDDSMVSALTLAAKSGVDVRIVAPHHWDKRLVHMVTRSYYRDLIRAGIHVYEYSIGFNHLKTFVADDEVATVGTPNLDFRSLYLHFECGVIMYGSSAVAQVRDDFTSMLSVCHEITEKDCRSGLITAVLQSVLRLIAPLL